MRYPFLIFISSVFLFIACSKDTPDDFGNALIFKKSESPYLIDSTFETEPDQLLRIEAGVELIIDTGVFINAFGPVELLGTVDEPVLLNAKIPGKGWRQFKVKPGASYVTIENAVFNDGTFTSSADKVYFNNVTFNNSQNLAWDGAMARFWNATDFLIENSTVNASNMGEGFLLHNVKNPVVRFCTFNKIPDGVEYIDAENGRIHDCVFRDGNDDAIDLNHCFGTVIERNQIFNYKDCGMEIGSENFGPSTNIIVYKNVMVGCQKGLIIKEDSKARIENNTFYKNTIGAEFAALSSEGSIGQFLSCVFFNNTQAIKKDQASTIDVSYSLCPDEVLQGDQNLNSNPMLKNPQGEDFSPLDGSPCIDAGSPNSPVDPDGSRADIGAVPYVN
jgi:hypothetical protein